MQALAEDCGAHATEYFVALGNLKIVAKLFVQYESIKRVLDFLLVKSWIIVVKSSFLAISQFIRMLQVHSIFPASLFSFYNI